MRQDKVAQRKNKSRKLKVTDKVTTNNVSASPAGSSSSCDSNENESMFDEQEFENKEQIDICDIAEQCVMEEIRPDNDITDLVNVETLDIDEDILSNIFIDLVPSLKLTMEEEFRICELEVNKDHLIESFFSTLGKQHPRFINCMQLMIYSVTLGMSFDLTTSKLLRFRQSAKEAVKFDLEAGGEMNRAINALDILREIPQEIKTSVIFPSLKCIDLCIRAFMKANSNKQHFIAQRKSSGFMCSKLIDQVIGTMSIKAEDIPCIDGFGHDLLYPKPWAKDADEENFFNKTLQTLGDIVKDDVKLGTIFSFLMMVSPSPDALLEIREHPSLINAQNSFQLLLFRYLHHKYEGDPNKAL